jgi:type IV pilus assembly protein PilC
MKFKYQARTKSGEVKTGTVEAANREVALDIIQKYGLFATFLENIAEEKAISKRIDFFNKVSQKDVVVFMRQLAIMLKAGVTPVEALNTLVKQIANPLFREKIIKISQEVESGMVLSRAFSLFPDVFPNYFVAVLKSGELSGELVQTLNYLADYSENQYYLKTKIRGALAYPVFVIFISFAIFIFLMIFVIPNITQVLIQSGKELPFSTKMVIKMSEIFQKYILFILGGLFAIGVIIFKYCTSGEGKGSFDELTLKLPIISPFLIKVNINNIAQNLSTLIKSGVPIIQSLEAVEEIVSNSYYKKIIRDVKENVSKGKQMSEILEKYPEAIPPLVTQMIFVGEKTGKLNQGLDYVVEFFQKEIESATDEFLSMIEPVLIVFLGIMVAFLAISVLMPIYQTMTF